MKQHEQQGFTLTELVVVIVIMGILAASAAPRFMDVQIFESRAFYEEVLSSLRYAQKMAVGTGCNIRVDISDAAPPGMYVLHREASCNNEDGDPNDGFPANPLITDSGITNPRTGDPYPTAAPDSVAFTNINFFPIVFNRLGQATNSGVAQPTATVDVGDRTITIWQETGLVTGL